jgi:hypothetical protein
MTAGSRPITADCINGLFELLDGGGPQPDASRAAVSGCQYTDRPTAPDLMQCRQQISDNQRMTKGHVRYNRPDRQAARGMQSLKLMQITFLVDRRRIGNS